MRWKKQKVTLPVLVNRIEVVIEDIEAREFFVPEYREDLKKIRLDLKDAIKGARK